MSEAFTSMPVANEQSTLVLPTQTTIQLENYEKTNPLQTTPQENTNQQADFQPAGNNLGLQFESSEILDQKFKHVEQPKLRLTNEQKRDVCIFHLNNPKMRQGQLAKMFNTQQYTISRILKERAKYLNLESNLNESIVNNISTVNNDSNKTENNDNQKTPPVSELEFPELEAELANWYQELKDADSKPSDKDVREKATELKSQFGIDQNVVTFSNQWVEAFKKRYGFKKSYYKCSRYQYEQDNGSLPIIMMEANPELPNDTSGYLQPVMQQPQPSAHSTTSIPTNPASNGLNNSAGYRNIRSTRLLNSSNVSTSNNSGVEVCHQLDEVLENNGTINHYPKLPKVIQQGMEFLNYFELAGGINDQEKATLLKLINLVRLRNTIQESKNLMDYLKTQPSLNVEDLDTLNRIITQTDI